MLPCLNEEKTIGTVINSIPKKIEGIKTVDILVVDDGSTDDSVKISQKCGAKVISHSSNLGLGIVFQTGLKYALMNGYNLLVTIDSDGQFDPADIFKLIKPLLDKRADFVTACRFFNNQSIKHMPKLKLWGNKAMSSLISRLTGKQFSDVSCGFRAYSKEAMLRLNPNSVFTYTHETFLSLAFKDFTILEIPIEVKYFPNRKSRIADNLIKYSLSTIYVIFRTYRDYHPLKFSWSISLFFLILSFLFIGFLLAWRFFHHVFSPHIWSGFVGGTFFFISLTFFFIGLIIDMLGTIRGNQEKILYFLKKEYNVNSDKPEMNTTNVNTINGDR